MGNVMNEPSGDGAITDVIMLGAGISGLVGTRLLLDGGAGNMTIIDGYDRIGGNHADLKIGPYTFDVGSFLFSDDTELLVHFPEILDGYTPVTCKIGRITPENYISKYPIAPEKEVLGRGIGNIASIVSSLAWSRVRFSQPRNAAEYAQNRMGSQLYRNSGLGYYMEKFYGVPAEAIDLDFAKKRMTWIAKASSIRNQVMSRVKKKPKGKPQQTLVRPPEGFGPLYAPIRTTLESQGVTFSLGTQISAVKRIDGVFHVDTDKGTFRSRRLFSTLPVRPMLKLCGLGDQPLLQAVELASLFYSFEGKRGFDQSIFYNFSPGGRWKRITLFSDFYGKADGREYFLLEVNKRADDEMIDTFDADFRADIAAKGIFAGDLRLEGSRTLKNAYPIYVAGAAEAAEAALNDLRAMGIESFGRQGGFDYLSTVSAATRTARAAISRAGREAATA